jgi:hypothetical protein
MAEICSLSLICFESRPKNDLTQSRRHSAKRRIQPDNSHASTPRTSEQEKNHRMAHLQGGREAARGQPPDYRPDARGRPPAGLVVQRRSVRARRTSVGREGLRVACCTHADSLFLRPARRGSTALAVGKLFTHLYSGRERAGILQRACPSRDGSLACWPPLRCI